jgi:hypothetical protein
METIITRLAARAGRFDGAGDGTESGAFTASMEITALLDELGIEIDYRAVAPDGSELHHERTVVAFDMWSGEPTLYVLSSELSGMGQLVQTSETTFSNGKGLDEFQLQVELLLGDGTIEYAWSWGAPGEPLAERSRATLSKS